MIKKLMSYIGEFKRDTILSPIFVTLEVISGSTAPHLDGAGHRQRSRDRGYELCNENGTHNAGSCHAVPGCRYPVGCICGESVHGIWT